MLESILDIKQRKEDNARTEKKVRLQTYEEEKAATAKADQQYCDYQLWRKAESSRRYEEIFGQNVDQKTLEDLAVDLNKLKERESELEETLTAQKKKQGEAHQAYELACETFLKAQKQTQKFFELNRHLQNQKRVELRLAEDAALDEFICKPGLPV